VNVIVMKALVALDERTLVAGMHPLGPGADVLLGPARSRGASQRRVGFSALRALKQFEKRFDRNRIGATSRAGDRWVDQYQLVHGRRPPTRGADSDAAAHRVAQQRIRTHSKRFSEPDEVGCACVERIIEMRAAFGKAATADIEHENVVSGAQAFCDEGTLRRSRRDARDNDDRRPGPAEPQIMLPNAVGVHIGAVKQSGCRGAAHVC